MHGYLFFEIFSSQQVSGPLRQVGALRDIRELPTATMNHSLENEDNIVETTGKA